MGQVSSLARTHELLFVIAASLGLITLGDILEILPFDDPMVVISIDGPTLWAALESALSTWPAQEGRFPILSGFRAEWDSRRPPGQRLLGLWLENPDDHDVEEHRDEEINLPESRSTSPVRRHNRRDGEAVSTEPGGRSYVVVTREYMASGHDGYEVLKDCPIVGGVDEEHGTLLSSIVRKFLLGSDYIVRMKRLATPVALRLQLPSTTATDPEKVLSPRTSARARARWLDVGRKVIAQVSGRHNKGVIPGALRTAKTEHMTDVDVYDGERARAGRGADEAGDTTTSEDHPRDDDLVEVAPVVDGRLRNIAKADVDED